MFKPASLFIGLRYTRAKRRNHFISFISLMSMLGIALGVLVLITVLSVMNGFDKEIKKRVFSMVPPITITSIDNAISNWQDLASVVKKIPGVTGIAPFVNGQVLLTSSDYVLPAMVNGIEPNAESLISELANKMVEGKLTDLTPGKFGIIIGEDLANRLGVTVGDKITMITPQVSVTPLGVEPRFKPFTIAGIFSAGSGFGFDGMLAFVNISDAQRLFKLGKSISGLHVTIKDVYQAETLTENLAVQLSPTTRVNSWTQQFGAYFQAVKMEKTMMFFILMLIIAVAVFNLVSTLVMVVNEKEADIAILRTIGATPQMIMSIFIIQGAIVGVVGTLLGVVGGIALALNVTELVNSIEHLFHVQFLSSNVYLLDYLPSDLRMTDVIQISVCALMMSLMATLYPAWRASRTEPVEALRYE
jgi:lipoprotein-releasing system permease protein